MRFRIEAVDRDTFNVWVEGRSAAVADGRVQRNERWPGLLGRARQRRRRAAVIKTGKSRGGCLMAVLERFTGA